MTSASDPAYLELFEDFDPAFVDFDSASLGPDFEEELQVASDVWVKTGYGQGIVAYLNFFLLVDFITTHDTAYPPRFATFKSMADSFYRTDLFVRDVTDSGRKANGGISSPEVRRLLTGIMARHERISIPHWMMSYFGFQLLEAAEVQASATDEEKVLHLSYLSKAYRIMGIPFSDDRQLMETFARSVEKKHAGLSPNVKRRSCHILRLAEMVSVASDWENISRLLPERTRTVYGLIHKEVEPGPLQRIACRIAGRILVRRAVGKLRKVRVHRSE